eukprot:6492651-Amphidinium_carterae.1
MACALQIMPDYTSASTYGASSSADPREKWGNQTRRLLGKRKAEDEGGQVGSKKPRVKSHHVLCVIDNVLRECCGKTLLDFAPEAGQPFGEWPYLAIASDQGPDMRCASYFMKYQLKLNMDVWFDPSHGVWRDYEMAQSNCNLLTFARLMLAVHNFAHGPWDEAMRGGQLSQAWPEYFETQSPKTCPLVQRYFKDLLKELKLEAWQHSEEVHDMLWQKMQEVWVQRKKGTKVGMARFGNWMSAAGAFDECWHTQLVRLVWLGFSEGYLKPSSFLSLQAQAKAVGRVGTEAEKQKTKQSAKEAANALRMQSGNALQLAVLLLSDPWSQKRCRLQVLLAKPIMDWHTAQSKSLRSTVESKEWLLQQLGGSVLKPLEEMWKSLQDSSIANALGVVWPTDADVVNGRDTPRYAEDANLASMCGQWVSELVAARVKRLLWMTRGWQGLFLLVAHGVESRRTSILKEMQKQWEAYEEAKTRHESFWQEMVARSEFETPSVMQIVHACRAANWEATTELMAMATERASVVIQSKISEDAFQKGRRKEDVQVSKLMQEKELWYHLVESGLAGSLHRFVPLDTSGEPLPAQDAVLAPSVFHPNVQQSDERLKHITSNKSKNNAWFSTTVAGSAIVYADVKLMRAAATRKQWAKVAAEHGWCTLVRDKRVAYKLTDSDEWVLSLGDICGEVVLGWPLEVLKGVPGNRLHMQARGGAAPRMDVIVDPKVVKAVHLDWLGPWQGRMLKVGEDFEGIHLVSEGPPMQLLELSARKGFYDLSATALTWVAEKLGVELEAGTETVPELVEVCVQHVLPELDSEGLRSILLGRFVCEEDVQDELLLGAADLQEFMHESDLKELEDESAKSQKKKDDVKQYGRDLTVCLQKLGGTVHSKKTLKTVAGKKYKTKLAEGSWTKDLRAKKNTNITM